MHEFKHDELKTAGGRKVRNPKQAIAIGLREAGASKYESEEQNRKNLRRTKQRERRGATGKDTSEGPEATRSELYEEAKRLRAAFDSVTFRHVRREQNRRADELCNEALDGLRTNNRPATPAKAPASSAPPPTTEKSAPASKLPPTGSDLHEQAVACLRTAAEAWARGAITPSPEEVWRQLTALLQKHWLSHLAPPVGKDP